jgi:pyruvate formate lyase activating enzyme
MEDMPMEYVMTTLRKYNTWVDKVVITGGEPTIHMDLFALVGELKSRGMQVKLDTNGSNPSMVKGLVNDGLVDYIAMDVKGPIEQYSRWCGTNVDSELIRESIDFIIEDHVDYEFRMTVVPFLHHEDDIYRTASLIGKAKRFYIQEFRPQITLNTAYEKIQPFSPEMIEKIRINVAGILGK